jgi:hypothetical protein
MKTTVKIIAALALGVSLNAVLAADGRQLHIATHSDTPLRDICNTLRDELGWQISYEEAPVFDRREIEPQVTATGFHYVARRSVALSLDIPLPATVPNDQDRRAILKTVFDAYRASGNRGDFQYIQEGDRIQVFQTIVNGEDGKPRSFQPLLDTKVSIPRGTYSMFSLANLVVAQVSQKRGIPIGLGTYPRSFYQDTVTEEANEEAARDVLARAFDEANMSRVAARASLLRLTWSLNSLAGGPSYFFNVDVASTESTRPQSKPADSPAPSPYFRKRN